MSGEKNTKRIESYSHEDTMLLYHIWLMSFNPSIELACPGWVVQRLLSKRWIIEDDSPDGRTISVSRLGEREVLTFNNALVEVYHEDYPGGDTVCSDEGWED